MEKTNKVIAQKRSNNGNIGYVKPIYIIKDNGEIERIGGKENLEKLFPNRGTIVIKRDFIKLNNQFKKPELFVIEFEEFASFEAYSPNNCKYESANGDVSTIQKLPLIQKSDILKINDTITLPYAGHRYVFIENGAFILGPYSILQQKGELQNNEESFDDDFEETDDEEFETGEERIYHYTITELDTQDLGLEDLFKNVIHQFNRNSLQKFILTNKYRVSDYDSRLRQEDCIYGIKDLLKEVTPLEYLLEETESEIIKWAEKALPKKYTKEELELWLSSSDSSNPIHKKRFEKLTSIKEKTSSWINFIDSYLKDKYFTTTEGLTRIDLYIQNNKDALIKDKAIEIEEEAIIKTRAINEEIEILIGKREDEIKNIENLVRQRDSLLNESENIKARNEKLQRLEELINRKEEYLHILNGIDEAKYKKEEHFKLLTTLEERIKEKETELRKLEKDVGVESQKNLQELYRYVRAITDSYQLKEDIHNEPLKVHEKILSKFNRRASTVKEIYKEAVEFFKIKNRDVQEFDVLNYITSIQQNFVTIFVGLPGVGKTSLANLLSQFISSKELSIEIPVGRGWNSRKNLLGFFNPLKGQYQPDEFGLIEILRDFNLSEELLENAPLIVTLDEANLSPIEHYWSDFISLCDKESCREIKLLDKNGSSTLTLPSGFKFLFTVNHDHTTELLSPRLIDRACIIKLDIPNLKDFDYNGTEQNDQTDGFFAQKDYLNIFKPTDAKLSFNEQKNLSEIIDIVNDKSVELGRQIPISPRKLKAITQYCSVVREPFKEMGDSPLLALDYAILQNIIPLINGQGSSFETRLNKLKDILHNKSLTKSAKEVEDILIKGKDFQYYTFF